MLYDAGDAALEAGHDDVAEIAGIERLAQDSGRGRGPGKTGMRAMKRASQPRCLRSNQPNISVGRSTTQGMPLSSAMLLLRLLALGVVVDRRQNSPPRS